ncbi:MAG: AAA family ATPase [Clostridia bacterium]|nr:AAA family ATPase [Clostridia bacterium]
MDQIEALEAEIAALPVGYISKKTIHGKVKLYHQWTENGKKKSKYLNDEAAEQMQVLIGKRRELQQQLKSARALLPKDKPAKKEPQDVYQFKTKVCIGTALQRYVRPVSHLRRRDGFRELHQYLYQDSDGKVFILCGLRRTGKTTLIRQTIAAMTPGLFDQSAFIQISPGDDLGDVNSDLKWLAENDYKYVFLDEVTYAKDFIDGAALFSDIYAASGMKIVLSGTDSLGFLFSESEELYDRCIMLHTTLIPYREYEQVLGMEGIDNYIRHGGTMSLGEKHDNGTSTFVSKSSTDRYVDSAIARNIQHSLEFYQCGGHFRHLMDLYDKGELTGAIHRVVEDINHRFTVDVLTRDFISNDLGLSAKNIRKDRSMPSRVLDQIDKEAFTEGFRKVLEILNQSGQTVTITEDHRREIKEYLDLLDLTVDIPTEFLPVTNKTLTKTAISQPGLRYAQAEALIRQLLLDEQFQNISAVDRGWIAERILDEIRGRMMEDIVLLETKNARPEKHVFRLQFTIGEFDMVVADPNIPECEIYEIKQSTQAVPTQYRFLNDSEKLRATEFRYGPIKRKVVIYRGSSMSVENGIEYLNVEEYLRNM